jgi:hypothetical protein
VPVNELVDLRRQPAAGPADRMIGRLGQRQTRPDLPRRRRPQSRPHLAPSIRERAL